jgi:hypothetical protein
VLGGFGCWAGFFTSCGHGLLGFWGLWVVGSVDWGQVRDVFCEHFNFLAKVI